MAVAAYQGFRGWNQRRAAERALALSRAAEWMRERRLELAALEVRQWAKPWPEADGDGRGDRLPRVRRARGDRARGGPQADTGPGRAQRDALRARGVDGGHLARELPARDPLWDDRSCARHRQLGRAETRQQRRLYALGLVARSLRRRAPDAISLLPATARSARRWSTPGVHNDRVHGFAPGRSRDRARRRRAGRGPAAHQERRRRARWKNCVLVDPGRPRRACPIVASAFAYAGQKCSAASRVLVHEAI